MTTGRQDIEAGDATTHTSVLVVDDHAAFREALAIAINLEHDLECRVAASVGEALDQLSEHQADVVLMDVHLPDLDGIEGTRRVKAQYPDVRVVVLTGDTRPEYLAQAAASGACGFLVKTSPMAEVLGAIRTAHEGGLLIDPMVLGAILDRIRADRAVPDVVAPELTARESEVLRLMGQGLDPKSISRTLGISIHTARGHVKSILSKLGVRSQLEAVVKAVREGILPAPSN